MLLFVKIELFFVLKNIFRKDFCQPKCINVTVKEENEKITFLSEHVHGLYTQPNPIVTFKNIYFQVDICIFLKYRIVKIYIFK